ncbi:M17 family peptidase N-terminal domain-containing protein, partial [Limnoraphis robusta]
MEFRVTDTPRIDWTGDALAIGLFEHEVELPGELAQLDEKLAGTLKELIEETKFDGKPSSNASTRVGSNSPIRKVILIGLGSSEKLSLDT